MSRRPSDAALVRTGGLARRAGVAKATIEHDLRLDLLHPARVGDQGDRLVAAEAVARLRAIQGGRRAGFARRERRAALQAVPPADLLELLVTLPPARCRVALVALGARLEDRG